VNDESTPKGAPESATTETSVPLLPRREWDGYLSGYRDGYRDGIDLGRKQMDDELASLQRTAHETVLAMAKLDPHEVAQRRRRERQVETAERHAQGAQPWPAEATGGRGSICELVLCGRHGVRLLDEREAGS